MLNSLKAIELLRQVALRPTKQRIALTKILFQENHLHITAEQLHSEAIRKGYKISLATVYNALNRFKDQVLLNKYWSNQERYTSILIQSHIIISTLKKQGSC